MFDSDLRGFSLETEKMISKQRINQFTLDRREKNRHEIKSNSHTVSGEDNSKRDQGEAISGGQIELEKEW